MSFWDKNFRIQNHKKIAQMTFLDHSKKLQELHFPLTVFTISLPVLNGSRSLITSPFMLPFRSEFRFFFAFFSHSNFTSFWTPGLFKHRPFLCRQHIPRFFFAHFYIPLNSRAFVPCRPFSCRQGIPSFFSRKPAQTAKWHDVGFIEHSTSCTLSFLFFSKIFLSCKSLEKYFKIIFPNLCPVLQQSCLRTT